MLAASKLNNIVSLLFCVGISLSAFGAVYIPNSLGYLAASPGVLFIAVTLFFVPFYFSAPQNKNIFILLGWGCVVSLLGFAIYDYEYIYLKKSFSLLVLNAIWLAPLIWRDCLKLHYLQAGIVVALLISLVGILVIDFYSIDAVKELVFSPDFNSSSGGRIRGFMQEPSHLGHIIASTFLLQYLISTADKPVDHRSFVVYLILLSVILYLVGSRGSSISVLIAFVTSLLRRRSWIWLLFFAPLIYVCSVEIVESIGYDIENYTSTATRFTLILASLNALLHNPFGYGYYGFYGCVQEYGRIAIVLVNKYTDFDVTELHDIVENLHNLSTKSTIFDFGLVFGIPFYYFIWRLIKRIDTSDFRVRASLVYFFLSTLSTSGHQSIFFFLGLAVLVRLYPYSPLYKN